MRERLERIFVQIASYRDPQLQATITNCIRKARYPERLVFGVCAQRDPTSEALPAVERGATLRIVDVNYGESRGVCWARSKTQALYDGESYTLQIDSHHRFARHWDARCTAMLASLQHRGVERPMLTAYVPSFNPKRDPWERALVPWKTNFDCFTTSSVLSLRPCKMTRREREAPTAIQARFFSGHFAFASGQFCIDVPYDPNLYFLGEETAMTVRSYTSGYDLFHPTQIVLWHEYARQGRPKHWDDHHDWVSEDARSQHRVRVLLGVEHGPNLGTFGLGTVRDLHQYECFAGISFRRRAVQQSTLAGMEPPDPNSFLPEAEWTSRLSQLRRYRVRLDAHELLGPDKTDFWFVGAHSADGTELHRRDLSRSEIAQIDFSRAWEQTREFYSPEVPATWTIWPHSPRRGWLKKITREVQT